MSARYVCKNLILLIFLFHFPLCLSVKRQATSGPYKTIVQSVKACDNPMRPYMKNSPITFTPYIYNISTILYLNGNATIRRNTKNVKYRMKSAVWENGRWKVNYIMNNIGCHGMLLHLICTTLNVKYDRKNCMYLEGSYYFKNLDTNAMQHLWASKMEYGRLLWRTEVYNPQLGTYFCHEYMTVTEPAEV